MTRREGKNNPQGSYKDLLNPLISPAITYVSAFVGFSIRLASRRVTHSLTTAVLLLRVTRCTCMYTSSCCAPFCRWRREREKRGTYRIFESTRIRRDIRTDQWQNVRFSLLDALFFFHLAKASIFTKKRYRRSTNDDVMTPFSPLPDAAGSFRNNRHEFEWRIISQVIRGKMKRNRNAFHPIRDGDLRESESDCTAESFVSLVCFSHATSPCWFIPVVQREEWIKNSSCCPFLFSPFSFSCLNSYVFGCFCFQQGFKFVLTSFWLLGKNENTTAWTALLLLGPARQTKHVFTLLVFICRSSW